MRLRQFVNEVKMVGYDTEDVESFNTKIHRDCKSYLRLIKGKHPVYRGMTPKETMSGEVYLGLKEVRQHREPSGMSDDVAKTLNKFLKKNGHARRDMSIMATSKRSHASGFGTAYMIFPKDKMKFTYVEAEDINLNDGSTGWDSNTVRAWAAKENGDLDIDILMDNDRPYGGMMSWEEEELTNALYGLGKDFEDHFHTNKNFDDAFRNHYEMWFECKEYYFADERTYRWNNSKQLLVLA